MSRSVQRTSLPAGVPAPPMLVESSGGGPVPAPGGSVSYDPTYDYASPVQSAIAPRSDMKGPWFINNLGPNTVYYGPSGVTSATGTAVGSGAKSAALPVSDTPVFIVCAAGNQALFRITNN